jgi:ubiquinone/menaquinone biosynthesis C-methylase UbiE
MGSMPEERLRQWVDSMSEAYDRWMVPTVFLPFAVEVARRVAARGPRRVLELAAGTGVLTREILAATGGSAEVTATDLNEAMVEFGRGRVPGATWQRADALELPFDDRRFDVIACQFGVMFFPDKPAAHAEARRVLAPDGSYVLTSWGPIEDHEFEVAVVAGLERAFPEDPPTFLQSVPHGYADLGVIVADLRAGGLEPVSAETLAVEGRMASAVDLATGYCTGSPLRAQIEARGGDTAATIALVTEELERRLGNGPVVGRMTAHLVEAVPAG